MPDTLLLPTIRVLLFPIGESPQVRYIADSLEAMRQLIEPDGDPTLDFVTLESVGRHRRIVLCIDDNGLLRNLEPNLRVLRHGTVPTVIVGTCFAMATTGDGASDSLTADEVEALLDLQRVKQRWVSH